MNEQGKNVEEFQSTCPARGTTGKSGLSEYIKREVANGNLVRIKKRSPANSESPAPIAVDYNGVTSQAKAANKSAMASGNTSIRSSSENSNTKIKKSERDVVEKRGARRAEIFAELSRLTAERKRMLEQDADYAAAKEKRRYATTFRISIHVPREGHDKPFKRPIIRRHISIHVPREGHDEVRYG